jgi:antitoxin component of RelBE/YafQ-DinJ toxin-antitoxin module
MVRMRTTIELDSDTAQAIEQLRRERGLGMSEAVNTLIRRGLLPRPDQAPFEQRTRSLGIRIDVSNVAEALDVLEGSDHR